MDGSIMAQGVELLLYGMGTVVVFLGLLVFITGAMSSLVNRFFPEAQTPVAVASTGRKAGPAAAQADGEVIAAISVAIAQHRSKKGSRGQGSRGQTP